MPDLQGKRALITAGTAGLGAAIAHKLAEQGVRCALNYSNNAERAQSTLAGLPGSGHIVLQADAFSKEGIQGLVAEAIKQLGGLDILIGNSSWTTFAPWKLDALADEDYTKCFERNVMANLWAAQAAEAELRKNRGSIVITSSRAGLIPAGSCMAYSISKAASIHLAKGLAKTLAPDVTVNAIAPGLMLTDWAAGFSQEQLDAIEQASALKRHITVEDVADVYLMLVRSQSITGQVIEVSAGSGL